MVQDIKSLNINKTEESAKNKMAGFTSVLFEVKLNEVNLSVSVIYNEYPQKCLPDSFKNPSGPNAKKLDFEKIDNFYMKRHAG